MRQAEKILRSPAARVGGFGFGAPTHDRVLEEGMKGDSKGRQRQRQGNPYAEENDQDVPMEDPPAPRLRRNTPMYGEPAAEPAPSEDKGHGKGKGGDYSRPLGGGGQ